MKNKFASFLSRRQLKYSAPGYRNNSENTFSIIWRAPISRKNNIRGEITMIIIISGNNIYVRINMWRGTSFSLFPVVFKVLVTFSELFCEEAEEWAAFWRWPVQHWNLVLVAYLQLKREKEKEKVLNNNKKKLKASRTVWRFFW